MCSDNRRYDAATVNLLQQAAANIEAERRRQYRAEMARELRQRLCDESQGWGDSIFAKGVVTGIQCALEIVDEMSSPVVCDSN